MPYGERITSWYAWATSSGMPRVLMSYRARALSRIRSTAFSPLTVEVVLTRMSRSRPSMLVSI